MPPPPISLAREPTPSKGSPARARFDKLDDNAHILRVNFRKCQTKAKMSLGRNIYWEGTRNQAVC